MNLIRKIWDNPSLFLLFCVTFPFILVGVVFVLQYVFYYAAGIYLVLADLCIIFLQWVESLWVAIATST